MSPGLWSPLLLRYRFPRVSGDEPTNEDVANAINAFSPRERG